MAPFLKYLLYAIGAYMAISLLFHAFIASEVQKVRDDNKAQTKKLHEMHRKLDELGWATKEGMRQTWRQNAQHQLQEHTGITAI